MIELLLVQLLTKSRQLQLVALLHLLGVPRLLQVALVLLDDALALRDPLLQLLLLFLIEIHQLGELPLSIRLLLLRFLQVPVANRLDFSLKLRLLTSQLLLELLFQSTPFFSNLHLLAALRISLSLQHFHAVLVLDDLFLVS